MEDGQNRRLDYLRLSVTDRCNFQCSYCRPENATYLPRHALLTNQQLVRLCTLAAELGVRKLRITGGEPLLREGLPHLIAQLKAIPGIEKIGLTTNGAHLTEHLAALRSAGLDTVNISLNTLDAAAHAALVGTSCLGQVLAGLSAALAAFPPFAVKINCVPIRPLEELLALAELARSHPLALRFIEVMPLGLGTDVGESLRECALRGLLENAFGALSPSETRLGFGPCQYHTLPDFVGKIGFISAISRPFCKTCNRLRLNADGFLQTCLHGHQGVALAPLLAEGDGAIIAAIHAAVAEKPVGHTFQTGEYPGGCRAMYQIGG